MGEKNDESKYMEGNYSKNPFQAELEYKDDLIQAGQLQMQEYYWESYLNAVEKLRKEHHYLVDGAVLRCSKSTTNPIKITQSNGQIVKYEECTEDILVAGEVILEDPENMECFRAPVGKSEVRLKVLQNTAAKNGAGQYFATVKDTKKGGIGYYFAHDTDDYNIRFFGNCKNAPDRDDECKAIIRAAESKELRNIGTCPYLMKLNDEWENFVSDVNYEEVMTLDGELSELITMEAVLFCKHGGFIMPVTSGQENVQLTQEITSGEIVNVKKEILRLIEMENGIALVEKYLDEIKANNPDYVRFLNLLAARESQGSDDYGAISGTHLGRYQIGNETFIQIGFKNNDLEWTQLARSFGVGVGDDNRESFLNNETAQEVAILFALRWDYQQVVSYGDHKMIGSRVGKENVEVTCSGLIAASHLVGTGGLHTGFTGEKNWNDVYDGNKTKATTYMEEMGGLDISGILGGID